MSLIIRKIFQLRTYHDLFEKISIENTKLLNDTFVIELMINAKSVLVELVATNMIVTSNVVRDRWNSIDVVSFDVQTSKAMNNHKKKSNMIEVMINSSAVENELYNKKKSRKNSFWQYSTMSSSASRFLVNVLYFWHYFIFSQHHYSLSTQKIWLLKVINVKSEWWCTLWR